MIYVVFQKDPLLEAAITPLQCGAHADFFRKHAEENDLPVNLVGVGEHGERIVSVRVDTKKLAWQMAWAFADAFIRHDQLEQEQRRKAGMSPISEELEIVNDANGVAVGARKTLRY